MTFEPEFSIVTIQGYELAYRHWGQGPPVVLLHGFATSSATWSLTGAFLPKGYQYFSLDLLGHGRSARIFPASQVLELHTKIIIAFLEEFALKDVTLVGHSFGGMLVLRALPLLSENQKLSLSSLILIDTPAYPQSMPKVVRFFLSEFLSRLAFSIFPYRLLAYLAEMDVFYDARRIPNKLVCEYADHLRVPGTRQGLTVLAKALEQEADSMVSPNFASVSVPTAIVCGSHDRLVPLDASRSLHSDISHSEFFVIGKSGHAPQEEKPVELADIIGNFLNRVY